MSYTPTEWKTGDIVTSTKLNKLEQGVANAGGGGGLIEIGVTSTEDADTLQKTGQEILDYIEAGYLPYIRLTNESIPGYFELHMLRGAGADTGGGSTVNSYAFGFGDVVFFCTNLSDYPSATY